MTDWLSQYGELADVGLLERRALRRAVSAELRELAHEREEHLAPVVEVNSS